jgi:DNA repair protein RadD
MIGLKAVNEWLCPEHGGYPQSKAQRPFPKTVIEWLDRQGELFSTAEVQLDYSRNSRYPDVKAHRVGAANDNPMPADNDNYREEQPEPAWMSEIGDEIPF